MIIDAMTMINSIMSGFAMSAIAGIFCWMVTLVIRMIKNSIKP